MHAVDQVMDDPWEGASAPAIIAELASVVERQLEAARGLDGQLLAEETARRQDLMFHLRLATQASRRPGERGRVPLDMESQLNLRRISALDKRLKIVVESVTSCLGAVLGRGQPATYGLDGRLRGR
ncbi:MAG: hypothetical protein ABIO70_18255 [Pseudomonadota bacterium]